MAYDRNMKAGHIRAALHQATNRGKVGLLNINSTESKSGMLVLDILRLKQPDLQEVELDHPDCSVFEAYALQPRVLPLNITSTDAKITVKKMGVSGGPSGTDLMMLKDWCMWISAQPDDLREELAGWTRWLENS